MCGMEIRPVKKSEWEQLRVFNAAEYKPEHIFADKTYYDWQFDGFTNGNKEEYSTLGLWSERGDLLGTFGLFMTPFNYYGKDVMATQLCNLIVKKNLRALGYGYLLLDRAAKLNELSIDHTINDTAWPLFMKAGWEGENLSRFLYVINPKNNLYDLPASAASAPVRGNYTFEPVHHFGKEMDVFWTSVRGRYPITVNRSADYLNWRFANNPLVKYPMFVAKQGNAVKAFAVLRFEDVKKEQPTGVRAARIIDFIAEKDAEAYMLGALVEYCRGQNIDFIDYFSSGDFHNAGLRAAGFVHGDDPAYREIPILFNPVSFKRTHLNFAVKSSLPAPLKDWYTMKAGGDQDRPF